MSYNKTTVSVGLVVFFIQEIFFIFFILNVTLFEKEHDLSVGVNHKSCPVKLLKGMWSGISNTRKIK